MVAARFTTPLLERERETGLLRRAWRDARAGRGSVWLLCAEAGGGKTRLATDVCRALAGRTLWGAAEPVSPPEPYFALSHALSGFRPAATRAGSIEAVLTSLQDAAGAGPIILVLDDLHFADEGTVAVVVRLAAACPSRPWLVLAAFRPGEGAPDLLAPLTELVAQGVAGRLDLPPLSRAAVARLVAEVRGGTAAAREAEAVFADSGGNPWFAEALARGDGAVSAARDRITLRLDRLERAVPGALRVLDSLAPATRPLPHEVVAAVCGGDSRPLRRTLAALRDAGILVEGDGAWHYRHDILRRSVLLAMIAADRRDAHRALAEALQFRVAGSELRMRTDPPLVTRNPQPGTLSRASAAELAMHFAEAADPRAVDYALRAAREARAVDAHAEAMAQLRRALAFDLAPDTRRTALEEAAQEAYALGQFAECLHLAEEALTVAGAAPELTARLHQHAARAAHYLGDPAADDGHLAAAEQALAGRPVTPQSAAIAVARVARALLAVDPERLAATTARALRLAGALEESERAAWVRLSVQGARAAARIRAGDPAGFALLEDALAAAAEGRRAPDTFVSALGNGYNEATIALFHRAAAGLRDRLTEVIQRRELGLIALVEPYYLLELVQRGEYAAARTLAAAITAPRAGTPEHALLASATALRELRAGSPDRAGATLAAVPLPASYQQAALLDLARLEHALLQGDPRAGEMAQRLYGAANRRQYARPAGLAAVELARAGRGAPPPPAWLAADAPIRALWQWAAALERRHEPALRDAAARLAEMTCPYEAALALRDAGDLNGAYRALRQLGATTAREQTAELLRAAAQPVPRRTRSATARGGLTDTEREVCRLVATGATNEQAAAALVISVRTVETHLTRIYQKTGCRGRAALILWWTEAGASAC